MANEKRLIWDVDMKTAFREWFDHEDFRTINQVIDDIPTVDAVELVHAHWEDGYAVDHNGKKVYDSIDCSVCEGVFKIESHDREYWKGRFNVCPFCGAKMDGGNEDG